MSVPPEMSPGTHCYLVLLSSTIFRGPEDEGNKGLWPWVGLERDRSPRCVAREMAGEGRCTKSKPLSPCLVPQVAAPFSFNIMVYTAQRSRL